MKTKVSYISSEPGQVIEDGESEFLPKLRSGAWTDIGFRSSMEDVYVCVDNFVQDYGLKNHIDGPCAFYGVFLCSLGKFCFSMFFLVVFYARF